jgi:predicted ArsR family transcriptional regulator
MLAALHLENSPAGKILQLLHQQSAWSIKDMTVALGVTRTAVRQPLQTLCAAGLVTATVVRQGRGRPHTVYGLSDTGQGLFPQLYEELACIMWEEMLTLRASTRRQAVLPRLSARLGAQYAAHMGGGTLAERLHNLVRWLAAHGVRSEIDAAADPGTLAAHGCPYAALARRHREVCSVETAAMTHALGVPVTLHQSRLDGHPSCQFLIHHAALDARPMGC